MFQLINFVVFVFIFDGLLVKTSASRTSCFYDGGHKCPNGVYIDYPFWYQNSDVGNNNHIFCGYSGLGINCTDEDGRAVMNISDHLYYVKHIDYNKQVLRVVDVDVDGQDCPRPKRNASLESAPSLSYGRNFKWNIFYNCRTYPDNHFYYYERIPCLENSTTVRPYAVSDHLYHYTIPNGYENCEETVLTLKTPDFDVINYTKSAKLGFDLYWDVPMDCQTCEKRGGRCYYDHTKEDSQCTVGYPKDVLIYVIMGVVVGVGGLLLIPLLIHRWKQQNFHSLYYYYSAISGWKKKLKKLTNVEEFLESYGVALQRYSYSEIKKMTNSFKDMLGQGGYGSVYQGKLNHDGLLVAVKVLNESKGNGEDFINEVATIGRTNHVNVVSLLGFCTEGTKRALVYEFMPNGSLEKFIYNDRTSSPTTLGWDKLYQIALGIARGLEYLHCRCNTRIVHFDIKPHNILLDQGFCPKISDFGLAKLCKTKESILSMVGARGTMGYIAPEIACRNLGGVSHKSDVYSYGMMVLEMIGGRKNLDVTVENMSGIYFPHWIYNQLKRDSKVEGPEVMKFEGAGDILKDATAKKMIIVALWCIQTHPTNRPSMTKVVEMLEGSNEELQMPPNPSLDPVSLSSSFST